ncbi:hypothetical protein HKX48_005883 [Thoreauomyces humboldtii]|nr:hypothetical protein HKX48_005883 [Thoreauomyces humboldtii]
MQVHCGIIATGWQNRGLTNATIRLPTGSIMLHDLITMEPLASLTATSMACVTALRFTTHRLVAGDHSGVVRVWRLSGRGNGGYLEHTFWPGTSTPMRSGQGYRGGHDLSRVAGRIQDVQFTRTHVLARTGESVTIHSMSTGSCVFSLKGEGPVTATHLLRDHVGIAVGCRVHLRRYVAERGRVAEREGGVLHHEAPVTCLQLKRCENGGVLVASGDSSGCIKAWNVFEDPVETNVGESIVALHLNATDETTVITALGLENGAALYSWTPSRGIAVQKGDENLRRILESLERNWTTRQSSPVVTPSS